MPGTAIFDAARFRVARHLSMLTKKELAERVGVSAAALSQYESGRTMPSQKVVARLALALGVPVEFFSPGDSLDEATSTVAHFRSLRSTTKQQRDRAFAHALLTWSLTGAIERHVRLPAFDLPTRTDLPSTASSDSVEAAARLARHELGLGARPVPNMVRLLESRGVVVTRLPTQTSRVFAFSCGFPDRSVVVLAEERSHRAAGRFDAAHELGHLLLHHDAAPGTHAVEQQANTFASEFLAPAEQIADLLPRRAEWPRLLELKRVWGISMQALLFRARRLGTMPEHTYRRAMTELNARGWRRTEPGDDKPAEMPILLPKAVALLAEGGHSLDDVARSARIPAELVTHIVGGDDRPVVSLR